MAAISSKDLLEQLHWRYATKQFDPAGKISDDLWNALETALVLTPSSYGLQPWTFIVIDDAETRAALRSHSRNQPQVTDAARLVVFAARRDVDEAYIDRFLGRIAEVRGVLRENLADFRGRVVNDLIRGPRHAELRAWIGHQAYIALGNFLFSAALLGIDACPLEGIEPDKYDATLGLERLGLRTVVAAAAGRRDPADKYAAQPKVRFRAEEVILRR